MLMVLCGSLGCLSNEWRITRQPRLPSRKGASRCARGPRDSSSLVCGIHPTARAVWLGRGYPPCAIRLRSVGACRIRSSSRVPVRVHSTLSLARCLNLSLLYGASVPLAPTHESCPGVAHGWHLVVRRETNR